MDQQIFKDNQNRLDKMLKESRFFMGLKIMTVWDATRDQNDTFLFLSFLSASRPPSLFASPPSSRPLDWEHSALLCCLSSSFYQVVANKNIWISFINNRKNMKQKNIDNKQLQINAKTAIAVWFMQYNKNKIEQN